MCHWFRCILHELSSSKYFNAFALPGTLTTISPYIHLIINIFPHKIKSASLPIYEYQSKLITLHSIKMTYICAVEENKSASQEKSCHLGREIDTSQRRNMYNRESSVSYIYASRFHLYIFLWAQCTPHTLCICVSQPTGRCVCLYVRRHDCAAASCWSSRCATASTRFAVCNAMQTSFQCRMQLSQTGGVCCNYQPTARSFFLFTSSRRDAFKCNSQVATTARRARCLSAQQLINALTLCINIYLFHCGLLSIGCWAAMVLAAACRKMHPGK